MWCAIIIVGLIAYSVHLGIYEHASSFYNIVFQIDLYKFKIFTTSIRFKFRLEFLIMHLL